MIPQVNTKGDAGGARRRDRVDYLRQPDKRQKVAHFLKTTNFRSLVGARYPDPRLHRRRLVLGLAALAVLVIGLWYVCR